MEQQDTDTQAKLVEALRLYVKLDDNRRAGCHITPLDWAECHQAATEALALVTVKKHANYWTEEEAKGDIELPRCIHDRPRNVFCPKCES